MPATRHRRFIPASAGNTVQTLAVRDITSVHPRERGEHCRDGKRYGKWSGSSPRARGTRRWTAERCACGRFIPASAGNTCAPKSSTPTATVHPRERGEHCMEAINGANSTGSSPRARGTLGDKWNVDQRQRFIPASAGNTPYPSRQRGSSSVHPRERGEHAQSRRCRPSGGGSSPRARGTL